MEFYDDPQSYDLFEGEFAEEGFLSFYERQIERYGGPVLELGCGSGRLTIPLAKKGVDIEGLDLSEKMLALGQAKAEKEGIGIKWHHCDMADFELNKKFGFIFIPAQSLTHLLTLGQVIGCFDCVKRHLSPDGRFCIELFNPSLEMLSRDKDALHEVYEAGETKVTSKFFYEKETQINHIELFFRDAESGQERVLNFKMRQFFPQEIDALLHLNGFEIEHKYGDHEEAKFNSDSPKQLIICEGSYK